MKSKYLSSVILALAIVGIVFISGCISQQKPPPEDFLKEYMSKLDDGNYQFVLDYMVDETGSKIGQPLLGEINQSFTTQLGKDGENITIYSVEILDVAQARDLTNLPADTTITEFYRIATFVIGEAEAEGAENFFGRQTFNVVRSKGKWHTYAGKVRPTSFKIIRENKLQNISLCWEVKQQVNREACYYEVARNLGDVSICERIFDSGQRTNCLGELAIVTEDASICKRIEPAFSDAIIHCYIDVARQKSDPSICDNIEESSERERCYLIARN